MSFLVKNPPQCGRRPRLVLVGCGALGSELCRLLIRNHFKSVLLVDPDLLELRNLALSPFFRSVSPQVGHSKGKIISLAASELAGLDWNVRQAEIADVGLADLTAYDLLISCTDSALARVETAFAARSLRMPMLDAAVQSDQIPEGRCTFFAQGSGAACYLCGLQEDRRASLLAYASSASFSCTVPPDFPPMTGAPAIIETVAATMLQWIIAIDSSLPVKNSFAERIVFGGSTQRHFLPVRADCPWHSLPEPAELVSLPENQTFYEFLSRQRNPEMMIELPWPLCLKATCRTCGFVTTTPRRVAWLRRKMRCSACGAISMQPTQWLTALSPAEELIHSTPRQLGLPPRHLYSLRSAIPGRSSRD